MTKDNFDNEPDNLRARLLLLNHYQGSTGYSGNPEIYQRHLNWLICNHPTHQAHGLLRRFTNEEQFQSGRKLWLRQVRLYPKNTTVLFHAAEYCSLQAPEDAVKFLSRADVLDPENEEASRRLSFVFGLTAGRYSPRKNELLACKSAEQMLEAVRRYSRSKEVGTYLMFYFHMELERAAAVALAFNLFDKDQSALGACRKIRASQQSFVNRQRPDLGSS